MSTVRVYNKLGKAWYDVRKANQLIYNEYIEMPATLSLLPKLKGKKVLDVGCGPGIYAKILTRKGARVWGIDTSTVLLNIAKKEAPKTQFQKASLLNIPFPANTFDLVLCALVFDHIKNLDLAFKEIRRVLKPKGILVFSMPNPLFSIREKVKLAGKEYRLLGHSRGNGKVFGDYFKEQSTYENWSGQPVLKVHRTLQTIIRTIIKNKFEILDYVDAQAVPQSKKIDPARYKIFSKLPTFCAWKVQKN